MLAWECSKGTDYWYADLGAHSNTYQTAILISHWHNTYPGNSDLAVNLSIGFDKGTGDTNIPTADD